MKAPLAPMQCHAGRSPLGRTGSTLAEVRNAYWDLVFATVIISMVPILVFYLFAQKKFIQGFAGGIKS